MVELVFDRGKGVKWIVGYAVRFLSLFAGLGGFDLGLERAGMECVGQVEIDDYCNKILEKHWPNIKRVKDNT